MKIQPFREGDFDGVYRLYRNQTIDLPFHHNVRLTTPQTLIQYEGGGQFY
jgi:hypothetical protein